MPDRPPTQQYYKEEIRSDAAAYQSTCKMAAAGELYDAATGALDVLLGYEKHDDHMNIKGMASIRDLRAAIKKAKGG